MHRVASGPGQAAAGQDAGARQGKVRHLLRAARGVGQKLENAIDFYRHISHNKLDHLPLRLDKTHSQHLPGIVDAYASEGLVQFFFDTRDAGTNIYILDEANRVEIYQHFAGNKDELVRG